MNKRSKSSINLKVTERLAEKEVELEDLKERIEKSKPILETIYDKVKLKESVYQKKIQKNNKVIKDGRELAKEYKKLYEQNLLVMKKSKLFQSFQQSPSNYLKPDAQNNITNKNNNNQDNMRTRIPEKTTKSKSVYEQYRERIERGREQQNKKNPEIKNLRQESKQLRNSMEEQLQKLRMIRKKSEKSLKKASSSVNFGKKTSPMVMTKQKGRISEAELKQKILARNRSKLNNF